MTSPLYEGVEKNKVYLQKLERFKPSICSAWLKFFRASEIDSTRSLSEVIVVTFVTRPRKRK